MLGKKSFKGGIHPPERKAATSGSLIHRIADPKQVVIPINQHFGPPNKPTVAVGDQVRRGDIIADGEGTLNVPVHASIAGTVKKIEIRPLANNNLGLCIIIENDGSAEEVLMSALDIDSCTREQALMRIRSAGIIGMGGAGFPAHVKFNPPSDKKIDVLIANGCECEPYLTIDEATMIERASEIVRGMYIVLSILGIKRGYIGIEDNKTRAFKSLEQALLELPREIDIQLVFLKTKYPQGGEKMLIKALTGKEVPSGGLPLDVGCVVSNVGSLVAIAEAFDQGRPLVDRGLTVTGAACSTPGDKLVPVGTLLSDLIPDVLSIDNENLEKIIIGGPMMGTTIADANVPIQKNTSGAVFMTKNEATARAEGPCIRCGRCQLACPMGLSPVLMNKLLLTRDLEEAAAIGLLDCIECASCSFVCPAHIELVQRIRVGKQLLRNKRSADLALKATPHSKGN